MARKPKLKIVITRVKLNPEQAVLSCYCYRFGLGWALAGPMNNNVCTPGKGITAAESSGSSTNT